MKKTILRQQGRIIIPAATYPWPHELRVARILANVGYTVEFIPTSIIKTADILLDGVEFEIKSPERFNPNTLEHVVRDAIKQSTNLIIDTSRIRKVHDRRIQSFLIGQIYKNSRIRKLLMITKRGEIIDIKSLA